MSKSDQPAGVAVDRGVRPGLPVIGCIWGGMTWLVSLRAPTKLDLGARLYTEAELDAALAAEREQCAKLCDVIEDGRLPDGSPVAGMAGECSWAIREGLRA